MAGSAAGSEAEHWMQEALREAEKALAAGEVPVGCVYVRGGKAIGRASNLTNEEFNATRHAEIVGSDNILRLHGAEAFADSDLYVTCEPCLMCAAALGELGVRRVIFGCHNDRFGGCGSILSLHDGRYEVESGVLKSSAVDLFQRFYAQSNSRAPATKRKRKG
uniref:CMP/dCMP-type deaminase domain-containing protein n=1 Tax=Rhizochromulina marina TaxID=1034831 RepID=A0A7S2S5N8_9STRA|mmetsp:Transcript_2549/g.7487  ORF Transcript_2549/g.7487 Transcript_2549/m.7487 type:complete len:163 (+) Transcript_2549:1-489(+)